MDWVRPIIFLVVGAILSAMAALYWFKRNQAIKEAERIAGSHERLSARVQALETSLGLVSQTILPMSTAFQAILVKELTHFHTPEVDKLLTKVGPPNILSVHEAEDLRIALEKRAKEIDPLISDSERDAAMMLPLVMKRAKLEAEVLGDIPVNLKLVTVAATIPEKH